LRVQARLQRLSAIETVAADAELIGDGQVQVLAAIECHLGGQSRQNFVLDAEAELPFGASLAAALEQRIPVLRAVRLHVGRNALFPASALGGRQTDRGTGRVEAEGVTSKAHKVLSRQGRTALAVRGEV